MPQIIFPAGGGGGHSKSSSTLMTTVVLGESVVAGDVLRVANDLDVPVNPGNALKALAVNGYQSDAIGIAKESGNVGDEIDMILAGAQKLFFSAAPTISDIGKDIFLDTVTPGKITLIAPSVAGFTVIKIGKLLFADGVETELLSKIDIEFICEFV